MLENTALVTKKYILAYFFLKKSTYINIAIFNNKNYSEIVMIENILCMYKNIYWIDLKNL